MSKDMGALVKKVRNDIGKTREEMATALNVSVPYMKKIENCEVEWSSISMDLQSNIFRFLEGKLDDVLDVIIDWVNIQFKTNDYETIISSVLGMDISVMENVHSRLNHYDGYYELDSIRVHYSSEGSIQGTLISLSGQGCRQFEEILVTQGRDWRSFFKNCVTNAGKTTRLDLAVNDYKPMLDIRMLFEKYENGELETRFRRIQPEGSYNIADSSSNGLTVYFGSKKSDFYLCFYEKDMEQSAKRNLPRECFPIKNRYELRVKDEKSRRVVDSFVGGEEIEKIVFSVLNQHLKFLKRDDTKPKEEWEIDESWKAFIGEAGKMKLSVDPARNFYVKTRTWLEKFVAPAIVAIRKIDRANGTHYYQDMLYSAEKNLPLKYEKMIKVSSMRTEEMITEEMRLNRERFNPEITNLSDEQIEQRVLVSDVGESIYKMIRKHDLPPEAIQEIGNFILTL